MREILMMKGARKLVNVCAKVRPGENVLVVTDYLTQSVAKSVAMAAYEVTPNVNIITMLPRQIDGQEPPECVAAAMGKADVIFTPVRKSITHTNAVKSAIQHGARGIMLTAYVEDMLISGGIEADFEGLKARTKKMAEIWTQGKKVRITTPGGTDIVASIEGRPGNAHPGLAHEPGQMTTVPNIEASVSPVEGTTEGVIVADASIPYFDIGVLTEPVVYTVEKGRVVKIEGGVQAQKVAKMMADQKDENVYNIAQLSVGLNPHCRLCGLMLEDEGVYGTAHVGIGTSTVLGGKVKTSMHYDVLMWRPTIVIDSEVVIKEGQVVFET